MASEAKWSDFASLDGPRTLAAFNQLLPFWVSLLLVVLIAWQLGRIVWLLMPGTAAGDPVPVPAAAVSSSSPGGSITDTGNIADAHIFGEASADTEPSQVVAEEFEELEETRLNLELKGTIFATSQADSIAIIAEGGEEKIYSPGDSIASGTSVHAIEMTRVVLNENGNLTELLLPQEFVATSRPVTRRATNTFSRAGNTNSIQSVVSKNVARLADVIRPTPYFVNGQQQGYRVYPGRDRAQFAALGLRPGDLIKDIDGQALNDPTQAMQIFQSLGSANEVSVTVERDGQPEVLVLRTSQLDLGGQQ